MSNDLWDEAFTDPAPTPRRQPKPKKMLPKRLLRLLLGLAVFVVLIVIIIILAKSTSNNKEAARYQNCVATMSEMLKQSDAMGAQLVKDLTNPESTTRGDLRTHLDEYTKASEKLLEQAKTMDIPKDLIKQNIFQFFILVLDFRYYGLVNLKPALMNALEVQDVEVSSVSITKALKYLSNSDFLYSEVFAPRMVEVLQSKNLSGITVPNTQFLSDPELASKSRVQKMLSELKSAGNLQAVHGVAISKVVASPDEKEIRERNRYNLTSSKELAFLVTIENQGNMTEKDIPIEVTLRSPDSNTPQKATASIKELKPKEIVTISVEGLTPTADGQEVILKVEVGPVKEEKFLDNNSMEATIIFTI